MRERFSELFFVVIIISVLLIGIFPPINFNKAKNTNLSVQDGGFEVKDAKFKVSNPGFKGLR